jgi:hypothetical protein
MIATGSKDPYQSLFYDSALISRRVGLISILPRPRKFSRQWSSRLRVEEPMFTVQSRQRTPRLIFHFSINNMKKVLPSLFIFIAALTLVTPTVKVFAATPALDYSGFVKCDGEVKVEEQGRKTKCDFAALLKTVISLVNWLFYISIPIAVVLFAWGGVLYMTGKPDNMGKARNIFAAVVVGFIIMITAWFLVRQVVSWFVDDPAATTFVQ